MELSGKKVDDEQKVCNRICRNSRGVNDGDFWMLFCKNGQSCKGI